MHSQSLGRNLAVFQGAPIHGKKQPFHGLSTVSLGCECMKHLRVWAERASSEGTKTGAGGQKTVVRGRPGLRTSEHDLFRNSSFFLARRECFAYAVSWKFLSDLSGTFRTNLSQVRLDGKNSRYTNWFILPSGKAPGSKNALARCFTRVALFIPGSSSNAVSLLFPCRGKQIPSCLLFLMSGIHLVWPKVGRARRTPHLGSILGFSFERHQNLLPVGEKATGLYRIDMILDHVVPILEWELPGGWKNILSVYFIHLRSRFA